jgi:hypothetical protein
MKAGLRLETGLVGPLCIRLLFQEPLAEKSRLRLRRLEPCSKKVNVGKKCWKEISAYESSIAA